jgi:hypothetical protein
MSAPDDDTSSHAGGIMNGHGVGIALVAIFVGVALVVAFAASDGAIFGMNFSSVSDNNSPINDGDAGGPGVLSRDVFDEGSAEESAPRSNSSSAAGTAERGPALQTPALLGAEPLDMSDRIFVGVTRDRAEIIDIETPIDTPPANDDEEEPQEGGSQQEDSSGSGNDGGQPDETGNEGNSGSGSNSTGSNSTGSNSTGTNSTGSNSTGTNSTSDEGPSGSESGGDSSSGEGSGIEASISIG